MQNPVICIGAALIDELYLADYPIIKGSTVDATVHRSAGGVSRNIAHQLALLGVPVQLISIFGQDGDGDWLKALCDMAGIHLDAAITHKSLTGKYTGILNNDGSLFTALLTNTSLDIITPEYLASQEKLLISASFILADANISVNAAEWLLNFCQNHKIPFILEPGSVPPSRKMHAANLNGLFMITPNEDELPALCNTSYLDVDNQIRQLLNRGIQNVWLHRGALGSTLYSAGRPPIHMKAPDVVVKDCTGAGDGSLSGFILGKYLGKDLVDCIRLGHTLSAEILKVNGAIATHLSQRKLLNLINNYYPL